MEVTVQQTSLSLEEGPGLDGFHVCLGEAQPSVVKPD